MSFSVCGKQDVSIKPCNTTHVYKFISFLWLLKQSQVFEKLAGGLLCDPQDDLWSNSTCHCDEEGTELW